MDLTITWYYIAKVKLAPTRTKRLKNLPKAYDVSRFSNPAIVDDFRVKIGGAFEPLLQDKDTDVDGLWTSLRDITNKYTEETVGLKKARLVKGLSEDVREACNQRRKARIVMMNDPTPSNKNKYAKLNKTVKFEVKKWKKSILDKEVSVMEAAHAKTTVMISSSR